MALIPAQFEEGSTDITSSCTFANDISWNTTWSKINYNNSMVEGILRFTTPSTKTSDKTIVTIPSGYRPKIHKISVPLIETWDGLTEGIVIIDRDTGTIVLASDVWGANKTVICSFSYSV